MGTVPSVRGALAPILLAGSLLAIACDPGASPQPAAQSPTAATAGGADAEVLARMAEADAADGTVDRVIRKCMGCSLHMDGDPSHKATAHGYEAHLCSEQCLYRFERDPDAVVMSMKPPE